MADPEADAPGWTNGKRRDGAEVRRRPSGFYIAEHPDGRDLTVCSCCNKPFTTAFAAEVNANLQWGLPDTDRANEGRNDNEAEAVDKGVGI